jgi:predicted RNA-binding Zn-ribbon protein involved in translation (DUF1610 family)
MRVIYPYCYHCGVSRLKPEEQTTDGKRYSSTRCKKCLQPLAWKPKYRSQTFKCPDCGGEKSWQAVRCKHCYRKYLLSNSHKLRDVEFRDKIRRRLSEYADETGMKNYWKNSSN